MESATCHQVLQLSSKARPTTLAMAISTAFTVKFSGSTWKINGARRDHWTVQQPRVSVFGIKFL